MGTKVYVGNLNNAVTVKDLDKEFGRFGKLTEVWIAGDMGFGFIHFKDPKDASKAVKTLDGKAVSGCRIRVEMSHGRGRSRRGGPPGRRPGMMRGGRDRNIRPLMRTPPPNDGRQGRDRMMKGGRRRTISGPSPNRKRAPRSLSPRGPHRQKSFSSSSRSPSPAPRRPTSPSARRGSPHRQLSPGARRSPPTRGGRDYLPLPPPLPPLPPHEYDRYRDRERYSDSRPVGRGSFNGQSGWERGRSPPLPPPLPPLRYRSRSPVTRRRSPLPVGSQVLSSRGYGYERDLPPPPPLPPLPASSSRYREDGYRARSLTPPARRSPVSLMDLKVSPPRRGRGQDGRSPPRGRSPPPRGRSPLSPGRHSPVHRGSPGRGPMRHPPRPRSPPSRSRSPPPRPRSPPPIGYSQGKALPRGYSLSPPPSPAQKRGKGRSPSRSLSPQRGRRYSSSSESSYSRSPSPPPQSRKRKPSHGSPTYAKQKGGKKVMRRSYTPDSPPPRRSPPPRGYSNDSRDRNYPPRGRYASPSSSGSSVSPARRRPRSPAPLSRSRSISPNMRSRKGEPLRRLPPSPPRGRLPPQKSRPMSRSPIRKKKKSKR